MYLFIVNPVSGNGRGGMVWREVEQRLQSTHIPYAVRFTQAPDEGTRLVEQLLQNDEFAGVQGVIAVGGDGTVHEVVNGLVLSGKQIPFGVIPAGSGNDFARVLQVNGHWEEALDAIIGGNHTPFDIGMVNDRYYFINNIGIGFDAAVSWISNKSWYKKWLNRLKIGKVTYIITVIRLLLTYRSDRFTIETEQFTKVWDNAWLVAVANIESYGGGMKICPDANYNDGKFQVCVVHGISALKLLFIFPKVFSGSHIGHPAVEMFDAKSLTIETKNPAYVHMDGEVKIKAPVKVTVLPHKVQVFAHQNKE